MNRRKVWFGGILLIHAILSMLSVYQLPLFSEFLNTLLYSAVVGSAVALGLIGVKAGLLATLITYMMSVLFSLNNVGFAQAFLYWLSLLFEVGFTVLVSCAFINQIRVEKIVAWTFISNFLAILTLAVLEYGRDPDYVFSVILPWSTPHLLLSALMTPVFYFLYSSKIHQG
ncbi:MAG TPA: hypothetical protein ENG54_00855 [Thermofilum sp.]|nr:hypothetical protein [Thermofilum sp.]